jgi:hypothetical protein
MLNYIKGLPVHLLYSREWTVISAWVIGWSTLLSLYHGFVQFSLVVISDQGRVLYSVSQMAKYHFVGTDTSISVSHSVRMSVCPSVCTYVRTCIERWEEGEGEVSLVEIGGW